MTTDTEWTEGQLFAVKVGFALLGKGWQLVKYENIDFGDDVINPFEAVLLSAVWFCWNRLQRQITSNVQLAHNLLHQSPKVLGFFDFQNFFDLSKFVDSPKLVIFSKVVDFPKLVNLANFFESSNFRQFPEKIEKPNFLVPKVKVPKVLREVKNRISTKIQQYRSGLLDDNERKLHCLPQLSNFCLFLLVTSFFDIWRHGVEFWIGLVLIWNFRANWKRMKITIMVRHSCYFHTFPW